MDKVWVVAYKNYDDYNVQGVFETEEEAQRYLDFINPPGHDEHEYYSLESWTVGVDEKIWSAPGYWTYYTSFFKDSPLYRSPEDFNVSFFRQKEHYYTNNAWIGHELGDSETNYVYIHVYGRDKEEVEERALSLLRDMCEKYPA